MAANTLRYRQGRGGRPYEREKARIKEYADQCERCGKPISAEYTWPHPNSVTVGHIFPLDMGGDPLDPDNLRAECIACNMGEGARMSNDKRAGRTGSYENTNW